MLVISLKLHCASNVLIINLKHCGRSSLRILSFHKSIIFLSKLFKTFVKTLDLVLYYTKN